MKKRILSMLLCLCMLMGLLPTAALAAADYPDLIKVGGIELTNGKYLATNDATTASTYTEGASYVALYKDGVLYLNGLNITKDTPCIWWEYSYSGKHNLTVELAEGTTNTLVRTNGSAINGESGFSTGPSLTIKGNGTLNVTGSSYGIWVWQDVIIQDGATVNATGTNKAGISNNCNAGGIIVKQGTSVTVTGGEYGVESDNGYNGNLSVQGGSFTAYGGTSALEVPSDFGGNTVYVGSSASDTEVWDGSTALTSYKYISLTGFSNTVTAYTVSKEASTNGSFNVNYTESMANETVTITATPNSGYEVDTVTVTDATSGNVTVNGTGNTRTFTMPASNVTVAVTFKATAAPNPVYSISLDTTATHTFVDTAPKTVTVSNTGNVATGTLAVGLSGANADSFDLNKTSLDSIAVSGSDTFTVAPKSGLAAGTYTATVIVGGTNLVSQSFNVTYTVQPTVNQPTALESVVFGYAYDVQRSPAFPSSANSTITLSSLDEPLKADGYSAYESSAGTWTLTKAGTYSYIQSSGKDSTKLSSVVSRVVRAYGLTSAQTPAIVIHELKKDGEHVAYGVVIAYDADEGYAVFIGGNRGNGGAGYLLSINAKSGSVPATADMIVTDFVQSNIYSIALDTTATHTFVDTTSKTVTVSNTGNAATGTLTVALSGANAASFDLNKTSLDSIAVSGSDTFAVAPKSGLAAGTYTATVTVSGVNVVSQSFDVTYTVVSSAPSGPVSLMNNGYPYGKDMNSSRVTLVMDVAGASSSTAYQWQSASVKDGTYTDISGATGSTLTLSSPTSGTWYRCVVTDGTALTSKAVQVVKPSESGNTWTGSYGSYYITNGTVAYMVNGSRFDVTGLYVKGGTNYMLQTSYSENWQMFSSTEATPAAFDCSGSSPSAALDALRVAFDESDACAVYFEADLAADQQAFSFGADTQLGNYATSGAYDDGAALIATVNNGVLKQIAMIGAASESAATETDPAFVISPVTATPASKFWVGHYSGREAYGSSTDTKVEGRDSGMTMSWLNVAPGGSVNYLFKVGTVSATGAITGDSIASSTGSISLELSAAASAIEVKVGGTVLTEGTHYTLDTTNPLQPEITFLAAAGLTHESVITVVVDGTSVPITNNIPSSTPTPNPPAPTICTVTFNTNGMGTAPAPQPVVSGSKATEPAAPFATGFIFGGWYTDAGCSIAWNFNNAVTSNITLYAKWLYVATYVHNCTSKCSVCGGCTDPFCTETVCAGKCSLLTMNFVDVLPGQWYTEAVGYVYHHGMMEGVGNNRFDINGTTTRAMIVTILWRLEGSPMVNSTVSFDDVTEGKWYTEAVKWAAANNIVNGYGDGTFGPLDQITHEQMIAILWRYAKYKGYDVSVGEDTNILSYDDALDVSEYAIPAMQWACGEGIAVISNNGLLDPQGDALRSEAATMLMRFCELDK